MRLTILTLLTFLSHTLLGQDENRFKNFHGLRDPRGYEQFFEAEGYDIFIQNDDNGLDEKGILKIKKKYSIKDGQLFTDSILNIKKLTGIKEKNGISAKYSFYLIPTQEKMTTIVGFARPKTLDIDLERDFIKSYLSNHIPDFVYTKVEIDSINFVGRTIQLGPICHWMAPHNIQCPDRGQMNWAIFDNPKQAEEYRDTRYKWQEARR